MKQFLLAGLLLTATPDRDDYSPPPGRQRSEKSCQKQCYIQCRNDDDHEVDFICFGECLRDHCEK